jgi:hypothetical protein
MPSQILKTRLNTCIEFVDFSLTAIQVLIILISSFYLEKY